MKNLPIPLLTFLAVQIGGAVWFAAQLDSRVTSLETEDYTSQLQMIKENRRYIQEVVIPSYEISDSWDNPHYRMWIDQGGWSEVKECKHD